MTGADALGAAVEVALSQRVDGLEEVRREPLEYDAFLAHRAVTRVRGFARVGGERVAWSLIEKTTEGPGLAVPYLVDNGVREFDAYSSGLLADLAPGVRAPRLFGASCGDDGRLALLLEDVRHEGERPLGRDAVLTAARGLGALAGRWLGRVPRHPWLFTGWIDRHSQPEAIPVALATLSDPAPTVVAQLGGRVPAALELIAAQRRCRAILEALPQTLCHHDAVGANVFVAAGELVLIDWESVGPGPVGADLASLLVSSVRRGDVMASVMSELFNEALAEYTRAARAQNAAISPAHVGRGVDAAIALRWKLIAGVASAGRSGQRMLRGSLPDEPPERARAELIALSDVVLAAARRVLGERPAR